MTKRPTKKPAKKSMKVATQELQPLTMIRIQEIALQVILDQFKKADTPRKELEFALMMMRLGEELGIPEEEMKAFYIGVASIAKNKELH